MTSGDTNNEFISDELLSGYLDNELSVDERQRVERALESDERCRRILSELKTLRDGLGTLPRASVDDQFQQRVMERILQATNATTAGQGSEAAHVNPAQPRTAAPPSHFRRYAMSIAAIAAGLAIIFLANRDWEPQVQVADNATVADEVEAESVAGDSPDATEHADDSYAFDFGPSDPRLAEQSPQVPHADDLPEARSLAETDTTIAANELEAVPMPPKQDSVTTQPGRPIVAPKASVQSRQMFWDAKQVASIAKTVSQANVDLVVMIRTADPAGTRAVLSDQMRSADKQSALLRLGENLDAGVNGEVHSTEITSTELMSIKQRCESLGADVAVVDSATVLATTSQPNVRFYYGRAAATAADSSPSASAVTASLSDSNLEGADLFIDLDAASDVTTGLGSVQLPEFEIQRSADAADLKAVLFIVLPKEQP
ncbi:MAG: zf-HC2 domain-containing protein [Planctomycetales bacterium]|nr:zf-HC2 domain-containing protein [Planctomycetales bacterium]